MEHTGIGLRIGLISIALLFAFSPSVICAQEQMPRDEFIRITENALDALDKLETIFSSVRPNKRDASMAQLDLETTLKKYERYKAYKRTKTQGSIIFNLEAANTLYMMMISLGTIDETFDHAKTAAQEARDLFGAYKQEKEAESVTNRSCENDCKELYKKKELKQGLTLEECVRLLCN
jgi:hypothetical protein